MNGSDRREVEEFFHRLVSLSAEEQTAYLDAHCRDATVRVRVEKLLQQDRAHPDACTVDVASSVSDAVYDESAPGRGDRLPSDVSRPPSSPVGFDHGRFGIHRSGVP